LANNDAYAQKFIDYDTNTEGDVMSNQSVFGDSLVDDPANSVVEETKTTKDSNGTVTTVTKKNKGLKEGESIVISPNDPRFKDALANDNLQEVLNDDGTSTFTRKDEVTSTVTPEKSTSFGDAAIASGKGTLRGLTEAPGLFVDSVASLGGLDTGVQDWTRNKVDAVVGEGTQDPNLERYESKGRVLGSTILPIPASRITNSIKNINNAKTVPEKLKLVDGVPVNIGGGTTVTKGPTIIEQIKTKVANNTKDGAYKAQQKARQQAINTNAELKAAGITKESKINKKTGEIELGTGPIVQVPVPPMTLQAPTVAKAKGTTSSLEDASRKLGNRIVNTKAARVTNVLGENDQELVALEDAKQQTADAKSSKPVEVQESSEASKAWDKARESDTGSMITDAMVNDPEVAQTVIANPSRMVADYGSSLAKDLFTVAVSMLVGTSAEKAFSTIGIKDEMEAESAKAAAKARKEAIATDSSKVSSLITNAGKMTSEQFVKAISSLNIPPNQIPALKALYESKRQEQLLTLDKENRKENRTIVSDMRGKLTSPKDEGRYQQGFTDLAKTFEKAGLDLSGPKGNMYRNLFEKSFSDWRSDYKDYLKNDRSGWEMNGIKLDSDDGFSVQSPTAYYYNSVGLMNKFGRGSISPKEASKFSIGDVASAHEMLNVLYPNNMKQRAQAQVEVRNDWLDDSEGVAAYTDYAAYLKYRLNEMFSDRSKLI
jgi:hypothetical protein